MKYNSYSQLEEDFKVLIEQEKYIEAVNLMGKASKLLPIREFEENYFDILFSRARFSTNCKLYEQCIKILISLVEQGYACPLNWERFEPLKNDIRYEELKQKNKQLIKRIGRKSKPTYVVHLPEGYTENKEYPLFINLHGDGENIKKHSSYWKPSTFLKRDFIVVYPQSSQVAYHNSFGWLENSLKARSEVKDVFNLVSQQYSIDEDFIIIGGFSGGAITALDITLANEFPVKGFIALCPSKIPQSFTKQNVKYASDKGIKGVFMEGEYNIPVPDEEEMIKVFKEVGLSYQYYINKKIGHWYPKDFSQKLEEALKFIL
ncbi:hypothetical protein RI065_02480 [Mycoplasmatota bacterium zrk1]